MARLKLMVWLGLVLVFSKSQCIASCVLQESAPVQKVPPCHRHHTNSNQQAPASCSHQVLLGGALWSQAERVMNAVDWVDSPGPAGFALSASAIVSGLP